MRIPNLWALALAETYSERLGTVSPIPLESPGGVVLPLPGTGHSAGATSPLTTDGSDCGSLDAAESGKAPQLPSHALPAPHHS